MDAGLDTSVRHEAQQQQALHPLWADDLSSVFALSTASLAKLAARYPQVGLSVGLAGSGGVGLRWSMEWVGNRNRE